MSDRVVPIDAERHQDVSRRVGDDALQEPNELAGNEAGLPADGDPPDDVGQHGEQADAEISSRQMLDEEVHARLVPLGHEECPEHGGVADDDHGEEDDQERELLDLVEVPHGSGRRGAKRAARRGCENRGQGGKVAARRPPAEAKAAVVGGQSRSDTETFASASFNNGGCRSCRRLKRRSACGGSGGGSRHHFANLFFWSRRFKNR